MGLRQHMQRVYNLMVAGLGISGLVVYLAVTTGFYQRIARTPFIWVVVLAPPGAVPFRSFRVERISVGATVVMLCGFAVSWGPPHGVARHCDAHRGGAKALAAHRALARWDFSLVFTGASIARVFFMSASAFATTSPNGYTTSCDLSQFGSFPQPGPCRGCRSPPSLIIFELDTLKLGKHSRGKMLHRRAVRH